MLGPLNNACSYGYHMAVPLDASSSEGGVRASDSKDDVKDAKEAEACLELDAYMMHICIYDAKEVEACLELMLELDAL